MSCLVSDNAHMRLSSPNNFSALSVIHRNKRQQQTKKPIVNAEYLFFFAWGCPSSRDFVGVRQITCHIFTTLYLVPSLRISYAQA